MSICERWREELDKEYSRKDDVVDNLVTGSSVQTLSAAQGVVLKELIDSKTPVLVDSATLCVCEEPDVPVPGYEVGDKYVDFLLYTEEEEHIYCLLTEFVKCDGLEFSSNKVTEVNSSSTHGQYPSAKSVYDFHDTSKVNVSDLDESVEDLGYIKTPPVQADWEEEDSTSLAYIVSKPDITAIATSVAREACRTLLKEKFVGKTGLVTMSNGELDVYNFEDSDFDDDE